jgi:hypothetical protein
MIFKIILHIYDTGIHMTDRFIRIRLKEEQFRKYKVLCAIENISMTDKTNEIVRKYVEEQSKKVKVVLVP